MWPTFLTAYRFPMKMESLYQAHVPSEWQSASVGKGRPNILCVHAFMCVCWYQNPVCMSISPVAVTFYVILYLMGDLRINTVIINRVLLFPGGAETANMLPIPTPLLPSTLSLDRSLNTMYHLVVLMPSAFTLKWGRQMVTVTMEPQTGMERRRRRTHSEVEMDTQTL